VTNIFEIRTSTIDKYNQNLVGLTNQEEQKNAYLFRQSYF